MNISVNKKVADFSLNFIKSCSSNPDEIKNKKMITENSILICNNSEEKGYKIIKKLKELQLKNYSNYNVEFKSYKKYWDVLVSVIFSGILCSLTLKIMKNQGKLYIKRIIFISYAIPLEKNINTEKIDTHNLLDKFYNLLSYNPDEIEKEGIINDKSEMIYENKLYNKVNSIIEKLKELQYFSNEFKNYKNNGCYEIIPFENYDFVLVVIQNNTGKYICQEFEIKKNNQGKLFIKRTKIICNLNKD